MDNNKILTREAKKLLKGNWGEVALGTLLFTLYQGIIIGICSWIGIPFTYSYDGIVSFYICLGIGYFISSLLAMGPLFAGYIKFINDVIHGQCRFITLLSGFRKGYIRNCLIYIFTTASVGIIMFLSTYIPDLLGAGKIPIIALFIYLCGAFISVYICLRYYFLCYFILLDDKYKGESAISIVEINGDLMTGRCWEVIGIGFSFIGWILLTFITGGIGILLLWPYEIVTFYLFYREIEERPRIHNYPTYSSFQIFTWSFIIFGLLFCAWLALYW